MFLCDECHKRHACGCDDFVFVFGMRSRGPCESCHREASCIDCHKHKFHGRITARAAEGGGEGG